MEPSVTAIFTISLGGVFAAVIVSMLVVAKRKKTATDRHLDNGHIQRSDTSAGAVAPTFLAAGTVTDKHDGPTSDSYAYSDSGASSSGSDGGSGCV